MSVQEVEKYKSLAEKVKKYLCGVEKPKFYKILVKIVENVEECRNISELSRTKKS